MQQYRVYAVQPDGSFLSFVHVFAAGDDGTALLHAAEIWSGLAMGIELWSGDRLAALARLDAELLALAPDDVALSGNRADTHPVRGEMLEA